MSKKKSEGKKHQHWVAASYLRAWCDHAAGARHPFVWRVSKDGATFRPKSPENTFTENELYTGTNPDGSRNLALEDLYGRLEDAFARVRREKIMKGLPLTPSEGADIYTFMAAQMVRTTSFRDHWAKQLDPVVKAGERLEAQMKADQSEERKAAIPMSTPRTGATMSLDQVRKLRDKPLLTVAPMTLTPLLEIFGRMKLTIFCVEDDVGFITSDSPCVQFDPEGYKIRSIFRPGLGSRTVEVSLPIAPTRLAVLSRHQGLSEYVTVPEAGAGQILDEFNRRTRFYCHQEFIVRRRVTRPAWFDRGQPPPGYEDAFAEDDQDKSLSTPAPEETA